MRGDHVLALEHTEAALRQISAGTHQIWPHVAASLINALVAQGRIAAAVDAGEAQLLEAERCGLGYLTNYIRMPLAEACSRLDKHARALELAAEARRVFDTLGTSGLNQMLVCEISSLVTARAGRLAESHQFALRCIETCRDMSARGLRSRAERLLLSEEREAVLVEGREAYATPRDDAALRSALLACDRPQLRAERALQLLLSHSGASGGALYAIAELGPVLVAQIGPAPEPELITCVTELIEAEVRHRGLATASVDTLVGTQAMSTISTTHSLVLLCHQTPAGVAVSAVAALALSPVSPFIHPGAIAARLSRILAEIGDFVPR